MFLPYNVKIRHARSVMNNIISVYYSCYPDGMTSSGLRTALDLGNAYAC